MTMLDRMRQHKSWLKWSLALVVLSFVIFYIPSFLGEGGTGAPGDAVAVVDGSKISVAEFRRVYQAQMAAYRTAYGGNFNEALLKQLGIEQQLLQQLVDERAALAEAERAGLSVTDAEVAARIVSMPAFQENGQFIGQARYRQLLSMQRPPLTIPEFEANLRKSLLIDKLRVALTEWITVSDAEVNREYQRRNEKVKAELVVVQADTMRDKVTVTDAEVASYFEGRKAAYRIGEKRKVRYMVIDAAAIRTRVKVPSRDIERYYNDNLETYSTPEQVRASHILFKTEGKKEEDVKARAEAVLKDVKAGKDFAQLATKFSEDEASAKQGGDLDYFPKGRMVPEFDAVAFALAPGTVSDLVKTPYGFHIIKVVDKKEASTRSFEEVVPQIQEQLSYEMAQARAGDLANQIESTLKKAADLDKAAAANGLTIQESPLFTREEPIGSLGPSPEAAATAFELADGQVSGAVRVGPGYAFMVVAGKQAPYVPKLDEVKDKVREDLVKERAAALARERVTALASVFKTATDLAKAVKDAGLELKTTELVARETAWPEIGVSPVVDRAAFTLPVGTVSDPVATDRGTLILRVVEHRMPTEAERDADRDALRTELVTTARNQYFSAFMVKAKQKMVITVSRENLKLITG